MRTFRGMIAPLLCLSFLAGAGDRANGAVRQAKDDPKGATIDPKKLLGKWSVPGEKAQIEFANDGKMSVTAEGIKILGKYKLEKNKLTVVLDIGGKDETETMTIQSLTDDKMVTVDSQGKKEELKKAK